MSSLISEHTIQTFTSSKATTFHIPLSYNDVTTDMAKLNKNQADSYYARTGFATIMSNAGSSLAMRLVIWLKWSLLEGHLKPV